MSVALYTPIHRAPPIAKLWHEKRKARMARLERAAFVPGPGPVPEPEPEPVELPRLFAPPVDLTPNPLAEAIRKRQRARPIVFAVCKRMNVTLAEIYSTRRWADLFYARRVACWLMRTFTNLSFPEIGYQLGGKDHSTVLYACNAMDRTIEAEGLTLPVPTIEPFSEGSWEGCLEILASLPAGSRRRRGSR